MADSKKRIEWIDGVKGIACLLVFVHHFCLAFYPATYYGLERPTETVLGFENRFAYTPFGFIINGNFMVHIFFCMSAYLLGAQALKILKSDENPAEKLSTMAIKRYPRLMLPSLCAGIIYYICIYISNFLDINYSGSTPNHTFIGMMRVCVFDMWIQNDSSVIGNFWMLHPLLIGSFFGMILAILAGADRSPKIVVPVYIFAGIIFGAQNHYMVPITAGVLLAYLKDRTECFNWLATNKKIAYPLGVLLLLLGLYLGGFPSYANPAACPIKWYPLFQGAFDAIPSFFEIAHGVGALAFCASFFMLPLLAKAFSIKPLKWLGSVSFAVYMLHPIFLELWAYFFIGRVALVTDLRGVICFVTFVILLVLILLFSHLFTNTVEKACNKVISYIK